MNGILTRPLMMSLTCSMFLYGCTSTETSTELPTTNQTVAEQAYENAPDIPAGDTTDEGETKGNVSVDNKIGREMNIVAKVQQNPNLSTLLELIRAADMVNVLQSPAPYTLFAPTNEAFEALPEGTVEALKRPDSKLELTRLLQSHVLRKKLTTAEMQNSMTEETDHGDNLIIKRSGQTINVGGATVLTSDVDASNGVIHLIDKVLVPPRQ